ncbi:MAG: S1 family peptidase [Thermoguttaceae bacterium]
MRRMKSGILFNEMLVVAAVAITMFFAVGAVRGAINDCIDATCRISTKAGVGSGCVFEISHGRVYVLTAAHVADSASSNAVRCEFWRKGHQSQPLLGEIIARSETADAAIIAVPQRCFDGILPAVIPLAPHEYVLRPGQTLTSVGCAHGAWSTLWKGHVLGYSGGDLLFLPAPANGRSGSAIFDGEGKMIVALLRARTGDNSEGIATSVQSVYEAFTPKTSGWRLAQDAENHLVQCPGGTCPLQPRATPYLLPYRYREQFRNQQSVPSQPPAPNSAWPTLPPSPANDIDLGPTNDKLDKIAEMLGTLVRDKESAKALPAVTETIDEKARQQAGEAVKAATDAKTAADKAAQAASEAGNNVKLLGEQTLGTVNEVKKIGGIIEKFGADPEGLIQKAIDRVNKVQANLGENAAGEDIFKGYLKDLAKEKIKEGLSGGLSFDKLVSIGGGIPAVALVIFGCVIVWKLVNNKPLAIEQIAPNSLLGQAATQVREHVSAAIEPIKAQMDSKLSQITNVATDAKATAEAAKAVSQAVSAQTNSTEAAK